MSEVGFFGRIGLTGFVLAAYLVTWVVVIGYTLYLRARVRRAAEAVEAETARMERGRT
ncbi:MAG TPA: CcmD family protein [Longimicrobiales bacterium]|nr:CcmD family protein [Longimicrobiales bacterium]